VVDGVDAFVGLVEVLAGFEFAAGHEREVLLRGVLEGEEGEVLLVVLLDGLRDVRRGQAQRRQFFEIPDDLGEFSVGRALDDVLLDLLLLLRHDKS
jgi:hypothetical protein